MVKKAFGFGIAAAAGLAVLVTASAAAAFWTDMEDIGTEVSAMDIGIVYDAEEAAAEDEYYMPGDSRPVRFTVRNTGDISVDLRPVLTVTADSDMTLSGSRFLLTDAEGKELENYETGYYAENGEAVSADAAAEGAAFRKLVYTCTEDTVLGGEKQHDETAGEGTLLSEFDYRLKLSEKSGNDFMGVGARLDISTYAIQHRNREEGSGEWISIAEKQKR